MPLGLAPVPSEPSKAFGVQQAVVAMKWLLLPTEPGVPLPHSCPRRDPAAFHDVEQASPDPLLWVPWLRLLALRTGRRSTLLITQLLPAPAL